jgi:hypothetical protein
MTNYASMAKRIRSCKTLADLDRIEKSLTRIYNAGVFSENEFMRLDCLIMDCVAHHRT